MFHLSPVLFIRGTDGKGDQMKRQQHTKEGHNMKGQTKENRTSYKVWMLQEGMDAEDQIRIHCVACGRKLHDSSRFYDPQLTGDIYCSLRCYDSGNYRTDVAIPQRNFFAVRSLETFGFIKRIERDQKLDGLVKELNENNSTDERGSDMKGKTKEDKIREVDQKIWKLQHGKDDMDVNPYGNAETNERIKRENEKLKRKERKETHRRIRDDKIKDTWDLYDSKVQDIRDTWTGELNADQRQFVRNQLVSFRTERDKQLDKIWIAYRDALMSDQIPVKDGITSDGKFKCSVCWKEDQDGNKFQTFSDDINASSKDVGFICKDCVDDIEWNGMTVDEYREQHEQDLEDMICENCHQFYKLHGSRICQRCSNVCKAEGMTEADLMKIKERVEAEADNAVLEDPDKIRESMQSCYICNRQAELNHIKDGLWICDQCVEGTSGLVEHYPDLDQDFLKGHRERILKELDVQDLHGRDVKVVRCPSCDLEQTIDLTSGQIPLCVGCERDLEGDQGRQFDYQSFIGRKIMNGSVILDIHKDATDKGKAVVLCLFSDQFVTWIMDVQSTSTFWGNYFDRLPDALTDFRKRTGKEDPEAKRTEDTSTAFNVWKDNRISLDNKIRESRDEIRADYPDLDGTDLDNAVREHVLEYLTGHVNRIIDDNKWKRIDQVNRDHFE